MRGSVTFITLLVALATATPPSQIKPSTITSHPSAVALLRTVNWNTAQTGCVGSILNNRSILTAARCFQSDGADKWQIRAGSTSWNSGGTVFQVSEIIFHEDYDEWAMRTDIAIIRSASEIEFSSTIQQGWFSGPDYVVPVNAPLVTVGWGFNGMPIWYAEEYANLHALEFNNLNLDECLEFYKNNGFYVSDIQLCSGFINPTEEDVAPRDVCFGEPGAPLYHNDVIVGLRSYTLGCLFFYDVPSVNTRVSAFINWITENA